MAFNVYTLSGIAGAILVVFAYFANQNKWLASDDWRFPVANLAGAALILVSLYDAWNLAAVLIEVFWAGISIYGLTQARWNRVA
ncbi:MAG: CBU_0592 family membrane protein [Alphaproteobacteria bacterium]